MRSPSAELATATFLQPPVSFEVATMPKQSPLAEKRLIMPSDSAVSTSPVEQQRTFIGLQQPPKHSASVSLPRLPQAPSSLPSRSYLANRCLVFSAKSMSA